MSLFTWIRLFSSGTTRSSPLSHEVEERRLALATEQRQLAARLEAILRRAEKQLLSMVERIRRFDGVHVEEQALILEQASLQRLLERYELAQTDTSDLLREWRDWMRAMRQGVVTDKERAELVRSELRVRGVITDESVSFSVVPSQFMEEIPGSSFEDLFGEWDQYFGERLAASAIFWRNRTEESQRKGEHDSIVHGNVKHMREAHGHAKIWKRMQG